MKNYGLGPLKLQEAARTLLEHGALLGLLHKRQLHSPGVIGVSEPFGFSAPKKIWLLQHKKESWVTLTINKPVKVSSRQPKGTNSAPGVPALFVRVVGQAKTQIQCI